MGNMSIQPSSLPTASVFVSTIAVIAKEGEQTETGTWIELNQYSNYDEFCIAATDYAKNTLGETNPILVFPDYAASFTADYLFGFHHFRGDVFDMLKLSEQDVELVQAYQIAFDRDKTSITDMLDQAKKHFVGKFENDVAFVKHHFAQAAEQLPKPFAGNLDWQAVAEEVMKDYLSYDNHYFLPFKPDNR